MKENTIERTMPTTPLNPPLPQGDVSGSLLADLKEIETLYGKLDAAYKKINPESTMMDFERGCYEMVKNIIARMEASNDR